MLLGVARGEGAWPVAAARKRLLKRFSEKGDALPKDTRVYAALLHQRHSEQHAALHSYAVALRDDNRTVRDAQGIPSGFRMKAGVISAAETIGLGKLALLVLGQTWRSGPGHEERVDAVARSAGLTRIHPYPEALPTLGQLTADWPSVKMLFTAETSMATDFSLLPAAARQLISLFHGEY
jgi:hypothetical protein